ncbi:MAG: tyrosine-type recombinase/integrase [Lawsonibacter sp.]|nr:tyrosine-type recombinase/integrase [Lawsonibacter sp.]
MIREYDAYIRVDGYLKEKTCYAYTTAVRDFFRRVGSLGPNIYSQLTLLHVTNCISKTAEQVPLGILNITIALRSFAHFITEVHPELPDLSATMICTPAKRRHIYVGYSDEKAQKILHEIDTQSVQGKRNYAIVMLAYGTGLRGCDIVNLKFENIDWKTGEIRLTQEKTNIPLVLPLDTATGNAIAEYILHGRPECDFFYPIWWYP